MSLILDALKKSESERKGTEGETGAGLEDSIAEQSEDLPKSSKKLWIGVGLVCFAILVAAVAYKFLLAPVPAPQTAAGPAAAKTKADTPKIQPKPSPAAPKSPDQEPKPAATKKPKDVPMSNANQAAKQPTKSDPKPEAEPEAEPATTAQSKNSKEQPVKEPATEKPIAEQPPSSKPAAKTAPPPAAPKSLEAPKAARQPSPEPAAKKTTTLALVPIAPLPATPTATAARPKGSPATPALAGITPPRKAKPPAAKLLSASEYAGRALKFEDANQFDKAIAAYDRALQRRPDFAAALLGRGWARVSAGDAKGAVQDFGALINVQPGSSEAYFGRAWAKEKSGDRNGAIADYSEAIELAPAYLDAHMGRGVLSFYKGDFEFAANDFATVHRRDDDSLGDFALIWEYLSDARSGAGNADLEKTFANRQNRTEWPGVIYAMLRGRATTADVMKWIEDADPKARREMQCVAYFFLGQARLAAGDKTGAREFFEKALATGVTSYRQYDAAKVELDRLAN